MLFYEGLIRRVEKFLDRKLPCLGDNSRVIATLLVLCSYWEVGDALSGIFLIRIVKSVSENGVDVAKTVKGMLESCGVKVPVEPEPTTSGSHPFLCMFIRNMIAQSNLSQDVKEFIRLLSTYTESSDRRILEEMDRMLEEVEKIQTG